MRLIQITAIRVDAGDHYGMDGACAAVDFGAIDTSVAPLLVIAIGKPGHGDDAIGPLLLDKLAAFECSQLELIGDVELSSENALDILGRRSVVFVDASAGVAEPFEFASVSPHPNQSVGTSLSPAAVLDICEHLGAVAPPAHTLIVCGYKFERGAPLSAKAARNVDAAAAMLRAHLAARMLPSAE